LLPVVGFAKRTTVSRITGAMDSVTGPGAPLSNCRAHLVAETDSQLRTLDQLAIRTGFRTVVHGEPGRFSEDRSSVFFFFHFQIAESQRRGMLGALRSHPDPTIRFAPAIMIIGTCTAAEVAGYIAQGFDDIISLPEKAGALQRRFTGQLDTLIRYYETPNYFGPDRRRLQQMSSGFAEVRGKGNDRHRRYSIRRSPQTGVQILARELIINGVPAAPLGRVTNQPMWSEASSQIG
jgi:hypothetical protein